MPDAVQEGAVSRIDWGNTVGARPLSEVNVGQNRTTDRRALSSASGNAAGVRRDKTDRRCVD